MGQTFFATIQLSLPWQVAAAASVAFLSTWLLTPLARWLAHRTGLVDRPDGARKLQRKPVALLGGVAVLGGLGITVLIATAFGAMDRSLEPLVLVSAGLSLLCAVGVVDDAYNIPAGWKLLAQIAAAVPMVLAGCAIKQISLLGLEVPLGPLAPVAAVAWLVLGTNAVNLIDGMDGLCATVALCIAAGVTAVCCLSGANNTVVSATALAGALAGFLIYNRPPASIYLGDAGSMVVGMTLSLLTLRVAQSENGVTHPIIMGALMAVPVGDVALAFVRRKLSGQSIFRPDRGHMHHRLLDRGLSVPQSLVVIGSVCLITSGIGVIASAGARAWVALLLLTAVAAVLVQRQWAGHHEWSLVRNLLVRRLSADLANAEDAESADVIGFPSDQPTPARESHSTERTKRAA